MNNTIRETWRQRWAERFNNDKLRSIAILLESEDVIDFIEAEIANARREWQEEIITYIGSHEWWEETEDNYRERFWFPKKYI